MRDIPLVASSDINLAVSCLCCGSSLVSREWTAVSAFFASRALHRAPEAVALLHCQTCGTRYFDVAVSGEDLGRLYADYRGDTYFDERHKFEPWYTRAINDGMGSEQAMQERREVLRDALLICGIENQFGPVLDHGGDRGQMLAGLQASAKMVYEISGVTPEPGVSSIDHHAMPGIPWDLILSCHVLEHLPNPAAYIEALAKLGHERTVYFFEVPNEVFRMAGFNKSNWHRRWISWLVQRPLPFKLLDFLSTAVRVKLRLVPPFFFVALREHLTFFSIPGLASLLADKGLKVLSAEVRASGHIAVVAVRPEHPLVHADARARVLR